MVLQVVLSKDCEECFNHRGGQCQLDTNKNFYCDKGLSFAGPKNKSKILKLLLGLVTDPENGRVYSRIHLFSYKELEEATYKFHHARQLGSGGFGTVYYAFELLLRAWAALRDLKGFISQAMRSIIISTPTVKQVLDQLQPAPVEHDQLNQHNVNNGELDTTLHL